jgi:hypothetical protein
LFYDFETTQDTTCSDKANVHVPILVCLQQFCTVCDIRDDIDVDCERCGKRRHSFFENPVGDLLSYVSEPRPWCRKVVAIAQNAKAFYSQFIVNRAIFLKWDPEIILSGQKIISMRTQHLHFLDSASYLPIPLLKMAEAIGLSKYKPWYPHILTQRQI